MSLHLSRDLEKLHREILIHAGRVENLLSRAVQALCERRHELVREILLEDDVVDRNEVHLEEECLKLLALHQPVAGDLRRITTILKINVDLERIADLGCNIAERAESLYSFPFFPMPDELPGMAENARQMLQFALDAFVKSDTKRAFEVMKMELTVDEQNRRIITELIELIQDDPSLAEAAFLVFSAARHIEQIADLAENIAEEVIYMIDGEIIRHKFCVPSKNHNA
jgi:phosphate transport system protein